LEAHRRIYVENLTSGRELACRLVNLKDHDVAALLIRYEEVRAARIDLEIARIFALGGKVSDRAQRSFLLVDRKHGDAVVTAIRYKKNLTVRMAPNLCWIVRPENLLRNC